MYPTGIQTGMQRLAIRCASKVVSCREAGCEWYLYGKVGMDEGAPFEHPAGAECGNHQQCPHPNCPCPQRLAWEVGPDGRLTNRRGHKVQDTDRPPRYAISTDQGRRLVVPDEWLTRLHEGVETLQFIRTRGL